jgi:hypothetical protein
MTRKRYYIVLLFSLVLLFQGCGTTDDTNPDAVVIPPTAPTGVTLTGGASPPFLSTVVSPLLFKVQASATDTTPVADANVRIDIGQSGTSPMTPGAGSAFLLDPNDPTYSTCIDGTPTSATPPSLGCTLFFTKTNSLGSVPLFGMRADVANCGSSTTGVTASVSATVTISASSETVTQDITVSCGSTATTTTTTTSTTTTT